MANSVPPEGIAREYAMQVVGQPASQKGLK